MDKLTLGQQLIDLLKQSVLVQALITLGVITCVMIMAMQQLVIPEWMLQLVWIVVGFYFGSKVGYSQGHAHGVKVSTPPAAVEPPGPESVG
jgi:hypothetical protein